MSSPTIPGPSMSSRAAVLLLAADVVLVGAALWLVASYTAGLKRDIARSDENRRQELVAAVAECEAAAEDVRRTAWRPETGENEKAAKAAERVERSSRQVTVLLNAYRADLEHSGSSDFGIGLLAWLIALGTLIGLQRSLRDWLRARHVGHVPT